MTNEAPSRVRVTAPGKSILIGEHSAVYARPALVAAIDRRLTVDLELVPGDAAELDLPQLEVRERLAWSEIQRYTAQCRGAWEAYDAGGDPAAFDALRGSDPAHLVKIALGEIAAHLGDDAPPGLKLRANSAIPVGAGFGSSAAAAVAVVVAYAAARGTRLPSDVLHRLTLDVERRQHGTPSGIDNATVIHGGVVWAKKEAGGGFTAIPLDVTALDIAGSELAKIRVFHTGAPAQGTGAVVARVRQRKEAEPERYEPVLDRMEKLAWELRHELEEGLRPARLVEILRRFEACLEDLGVVPERVREIVRRVEEKGGAAKISGAGALDGRGAGSLLVYHPDVEEMARWDFFDDLEALDLRLGAPGVRRELMEP